ncbi:thiamine phosphate synthase [Sphingomicrobium sp. XHP0235]|uniref:thiamine phosphate synthase n=1 Tax=Sphingomicrobium aquimarinum TaxID=3133971 RepID=UPI0031FEC410
MIDDDDPFTPPPRQQPCDLYLISPADVSGDFAARLKDAVAHQAVTAFQLRLKGTESHDVARAAAPLQEICAEADVAFIVNDDVAMAKRLDADGVHLGQGDGDVRDARAVLGPSKQIGVTCHASRHLAMEAGEAGADYVAFGSFFPSATKPSEHRPEPPILSWWAGLFELPCVAIGGITAENCAPLVRAGADFLAVSQAVWSARDVTAAIEAFVPNLNEG